MSDVKRRKKEGRRDTRSSYDKAGFRGKSRWCSQSRAAGLGCEGSVNKRLRTGSVSSKEPHKLGLGVGEGRPVTAALLESGQKDPKFKGCLCYHSKFQALLSTLIRVCRRTKNKIDRLGVRLRGKVFA